jgi:uncharacterized integral membrane protein
MSSKRSIYFFILAIALIIVGAIVKLTYTETKLSLPLFLAGMLSFVAGVVSLITIVNHKKINQHWISGASLRKQRR